MQSKTHTKPNVRWNGQFSSCPIYALKYTSQKNPNYHGNSAWKRIGAKKKPRKKNNNNNSHKHNDITKCFYCLFYAFQMAWVISQNVYPRQIDLDTQAKSLLPLFNIMECTKEENGKMKNNSRCGPALWPTDVRWGWGKCWRMWCWWADSRL